MEKMKKHVCDDMKTEKKTQIYFVGIKIQQFNSTWCLRQNHFNLLIYRQDSIKNTVGRSAK